MPLLVPVILGSVRSDRQGIKAARFILAKLRERGHEAVLVDPMELDLPLLDRMYKEYPKGTAPEKLERLADLYRRADGFVIVTAEYNQSIPPALKNTLDYFLEEYFWRPSTIVSYSAGRFGGVRAAIALRPVLAEMGMPSLPSILAIPSIGKALADDGSANEAWIDKSSVKFLDEFEWYAEALKAKRDAGGVPY
ncbi:NADPH-dependent FMN reductase [Aurantimonas sp. VKM B-3413]|uniref:NADPH-dependent FMN reductase n=1 Tax=Aurantimonas sp. VKM B-3413 TaxID=2779401 RepID=UPI001E526433|nr:NAD(P)H-dependent oxidoreductase [Aurantimonas sp. VKM B-3413]MCB8838948.1 NAD(P)H-dependent oxidoreductase [Aurantimonas sp. VKM B-3413]